MSLLDDVAAHIVGLGNPWATTNVFKAEMGSTPDLACCVYEYPGELAHMLGGGAAPLETARFQVVVRASGYADARSNALALSMLSRTRPGQVSGTTGSWLRTLPTPFPMMRMAGNFWPSTTPP